MLAEYFSFIKKLIWLIPFNLSDYIIFLILSIYVFEDASLGLINSGIGFFSTIIAFFTGLIFYSFLSHVITLNLRFTKGIADALSFLLIVVVSFVIASTVLTLLKKRFVDIRFPRKADMIGGSIFGFLSFYFIASFVIALLLSLPVSSVIKDAVRNSFTGRNLFSNTQGMENLTKKIFGGAINDTINFLTVEPTSTQIVELNFKVSSPEIDEPSQRKMLQLVNKERTKHNVAPLVEDGDLLRLAQEHARDMLKRGYFSHYTPEGLSPFDRMAEENIVYRYAGENLAFAPDPQIAMDGFMKSEGHRENILSTNFKKAGIGVLDAGIFGKMFVQEFTD